MSGQSARPRAELAQLPHSRALILVDGDGQLTAGRDRVEGLLISAGRALHIDGDLETSRKWFDAAYRAAEQNGDWVAMGIAALGFGGLWLHAQRNMTGVVLVENRLRAALAVLDQQSSVGLRVRTRLAAESDYRSGGHAAILAAAEQARQAGHPIAIAEAVSLAHHCLLGPGQGPLRHALAQELISESFRTSRPSDRLMGMLWSVVDLLLDGDRRAERRLAELRELLAEQGHLAVGFVVRAIDVMLSIRAGRLEDAETQARECVESGTAAGDIDALGWYGGQLVAIRWYQGRIAELLPMLQEMVNSPTLSVVDNSYLAALAMAAAAAGDHGQASAALARLRGGDLSLLPRSSSWLVTLGGIVETAFLLADGELLSEAYELMAPFAHLPMMGSLGITCIGSVQHALGVASLGLGEVKRAVEHLRAAVRENQTIGHMPAIARSRARLAEALALRGETSDIEEAARELEMATRDAAVMGVELPAMAERTKSEILKMSGTQHVVLRRRGRQWRIERGRHAAVVDDSLGMAYLAALVANPGYEIPAVELAAGRGLPTFLPAESMTDVRHPILDAQAKRAYQDRIAALKAEIDEHEANNDLVRAERVRAECEWLLTELAAATGLGGRARNFTGSEERARISVGKAIRRAISRIASVEPAIGEALSAAVHTGLRCYYRPY